MDLLTLLIGSILVGGLTGFVSHLLRNNNKMIKPRKLKYSYDLGFWADVIYGGVASVFAVTYLLPTPNDIETLIAYSILAGMSAQSVLLHRKIDTERTKAKHEQTMASLEKTPLKVVEKSGESEKEE